MAVRATSVVLLVLGIGVGAGGLALGAFLASGNNGWPSSLLYSVVGLVGAPLSALAWTSRRSRRCQMMAGVALLLGLLASMGLLLELTHELSEITHAWSQVPLAVAIWFGLWSAWGSAAVGRLVFSKPPHTRHRLSSRRGDAGR
ncbi:MAG: hypothetical protein IT531_19220 [Burkholderiales bacterium]|nr:hypothetical protein [Burkholderiales bacterium]